MGTIRVGSMAQTYRHEHPAKYAARKSKMSWTEMAPDWLKSPGQARHVVGEHAAPIQRNWSPSVAQSAACIIRHCPPLRLQQAPRQGSGVHVLPGAPGVPVQALATAVVHVPFAAQHAPGWNATERSMSHPQAVSVPLLGPPLDAAAIVYDPGCMVPETDCGVVPMVAGL